MPFLGRPALFRCPQSACDVVELLPQPDIIQQGEVWRLEGEDAGEIRFRRVHHPQQIAAGLDGCEQSRKLRISVTRIENGPAPFSNMAWFLL